VIIIGVVCHTRGLELITWPSLIVQHLRSEIFHEGIRCILSL